MAMLTVRQVICLGRQDVARISSCLIQVRKKSDVTIQNYKRGTGGRSSYSGVTATVFGASGFLGRYVVNNLGKTGSQVIIPYRGDHYDVFEQRPAADLGQMLYTEFHLNDEESIKKAMAYSNVVINLIGRDFETRNFSFKDVHVDGARRIARAAKEMGVGTLIHFSALNASPDPERAFKMGGSDFLRTKYEGEVAVREEFPEAIIFRPADMFGEEDRFIRTYGSTFRRSMGHRIPLWKKGNSTVKQPVYVADVAKAVTNVLKDPDAAGKTFEAVGPTRYYLSDMVDFFWRCCRYPENSRTRIWPTFWLKTKFFENVHFLFHGTPPFVWDRIEKDHVTDKTTGCPNLEDLNINLTKLETVARFQLQFFMKARYYAEELDEFSETEAPVPAELIDSGEVQRTAPPVPLRTYIHSSLRREVSILLLVMFIFYQVYET